MHAELHDNKDPQHSPKKEASSLVVKTKLSANLKAMQEMFLADSLSISSSDRRKSHLRGF